MYGNLACDGVHCGRFCDNVVGSKVVCEKMLCHKVVADKHLYDRCSLTKML